MLKSQKYSDAVFSSINALADKSSTTAKSYKSLCKRGGGIFRTVGLIQFVTFLEAKGKKEEHYKLLANHLQQELNKVKALQSDSMEDFLSRVRGLDLPAYMQASRSVLALLLWHKRIAEILIEGTVDLDNGGE